MRSPFTPEQFIANFQQHNLGVFPAQLVAYLLGMVMVALVVRLSRHAVIANGFLLWRRSPPPQAQSS